MGSHTEKNIINLPEGSGGVGKTSSGANPEIAKMSYETPGEFALLQNAYKEQVSIGVREGGIGSIKTGTPSLFNPFQIFRYSRFGTGDAYNTKNHYDNSGSGNPALTNVLESLGQSIGGGVISSILSSATDILKNTQIPIKGNSGISENPTASSIIKWSQNQTVGDNIPIAPYAMTDFLWCKHYGKIPNNRLVTLRRYTLPVEDNLAINQRKMPLVPVAQAITWFGKDVDNPLSSILSLNWNFNWLPKSAKIQDIQGNEIPVEALTKLLGGGSKTDEFLKLLIADSSDMSALTGADKLAQDWIKGSYGEEGPYWNRVLGPVNVIDSTLMRDRGFGYQEDITLKFNYSLRSYNLINPKIAFLDLLSNFLSLTYNTAPFWGGGLRYFKKTGLTFSAFPGYEKLMDGDVLGAGLEALDKGATIFKEGLASTNAMLSGIMGGDAKSKDELNKLATEKTGVYLASRIKEAGVLQAPLLIRSILDGRAVGEWHMTVGNPMNPIATIGNLCMSKTSMKFKEDSLGIDDFPTEVEFTVTLKHGRPRAMQDIERIFNLGNGQLSRSPLATPGGASSKNSFGEANSVGANAQFSGLSPEKQLAKDTGKPVVTLTAEEQQKFADDVSKYGARVNRFYGQFFANSLSIPDYFTSLKTKD